MNDLVIIKVYNDPGHGWGAVKRSLLKELDIEHKVSPYSYQRGRTVYLEEDCDLSLLCGTLQEKDIDIKFVEKYTDKRSPIRSYEHFQPELT